MPRIALLPLLLASLPAMLSAQGRTERGAFITSLGTDTLAVEQFTRTPARLETDLAVRVPRTRRIHFVATLNPDQTVARLEIAVQPAVPAPDAPAFSGEMVFGKDSAITTVHAGDSTQTLRTATAAGAMPISSASYALYEQIFLHLKKSGRDSVAFQIVPIGGNQAYPTYAVRRGPDAMDFSYFGSPAHAKVDKEGNLLFLDGRETTNKVLVKRVPKADVDGALKMFAARDAAEHPMGQLSPRDTVRATIGSAHIVIDYGRPHKRGREIFGTVVPWDQVWRTGANAATGFTTDADLKVGGTTIPKGSYTLWSLPTKNGAKLIVNSQTGQWGTDYDASKDFARVDVATESLPQPVEIFTIAIDPQGNGGMLKLVWDRTQYSLPFTVQ
jgi:Protein of unknown function (DUF2911)